MEALSVHLYCSVRLEGVSGEGDESEATWFLLMQKASTFGEALRGHVAIMDRHDPERRVALHVDEWGVWYATPTKQQQQQQQQRRQRQQEEAAVRALDEAVAAVDITEAAVEAGATAAAGVASTLAQAQALLEQPCTLRDGLVAALCLHQMIEQCERVLLANLAQAVNVLHAPLQTCPTTSAAASSSSASTTASSTSAAAYQLVRTPTFHVLAMLGVHRDGKRLHAQLVRSTPYNHGSAAVPRLSVVATCDEAGTVHVSVVHVHPHAGTSLSIELRGMSAAAAAASAAASTVNADPPKSPPQLHLEKASALTSSKMGALSCEPVALGATAARIDGARLLLQLPPKSLVVVALSLK